jgi:hypothetical protein
VVLLPIKKVKDNKSRILTKMNQIQTQESKNRIKQLAQARLNNKVAQSSNTCDILNNDNNKVAQIGVSCDIINNTENTHNTSETSLTSLSYVTNNTIDVTPVIPTDSEGNDNTICTEFATFFKDPTTLYIPKSILKELTSRYISKSLLNAIDTDETIAIEKCLIFLNNLCSLFFNPEREYKVLNSELLHEQLKGDKDNTYIYTKVINLLLVGTKEKGAVIEILSDENERHIYGKGIISKRYKITDSYLKLGVSKYKLKTEYLITRRMKSYYKQIAEANNNVIGKNLMNLYSTLDLPTENEILLEGKRLSKIKAKTKKGKLITYRNKRSDDKFKDIKQHSFIEDNIKMYKYLTDDFTFIVPFIGDERSGGRVVDSFTLMPSWIRSMVKIDDEAIVEVDIKALHPNLSIKIFGGIERFITHQKVAEKASIDVDKVKIEHLSFFNKEVWQMKASPLWEYYSTNEPEMIQNIIQDKQKNGYKNTSKRLFKMEVEIISEVISRLNKLGMFVGYIYDALFCKESDAETIKDMMNQVLMEFEVFTVASYDGMVEANTNVLSIENKEVIVDVAKDETITPTWTITPEYNYNEVQRAEYIPNQFVINEVDKLEIPQWGIIDDYIKPDWCN